MTKVFHVPAHIPVSAYSQAISLIVSAQNLLSYYSKNKYSDNQNQSEVTQSTDWVQNYFHKSI